MDGELLPCPFCGATGDMLMLCHDGSVRYVGCIECGACGSYRPTDAEAIAAWNNDARARAALGGDGDAS